MDKKEYIERGALMYRLEYYCDHTSGDSKYAYGVALKEVRSAPAADVAPVVHGEWKQTEESLGWNEVSCAECSVCKETWVLDELELDEFTVFWHYCPNCGAKMDGGNRNADA